MDAKIETSRLSRLPSSTESWSLGRRFTATFFSLPLLLSRNLPSQTLLLFCDGARVCGGVVSCVCVLRGVDAPATAIGTHSPCAPSLEITPLSAKSSLGIASSCMIAAAVASASASASAALALSALARGTDARGKVDASSAETDVVLNIGGGEARGKAGGPARGHAHGSAQGVVQATATRRQRGRRGPRSQRTRTCRRRSGDSRSMRRRARGSAGCTRGAACAGGRRQARARGRPTR